MSDAAPDETSEARPRVTGSFVAPDEPATPLLVAVGRVVFAVAGLEKALQLEHSRLLMAQAAWETGDADPSLRQQIAATERMTAGQLLRQLRSLGLSAELDARVSDVVDRRNRLVHHMYEDAALVRAFSGGEHLERMVERLEELAIAAGELAIELQMFALPKPEAMFGISRAELIEVFKNLNPEAIVDPGDRKQVQAIQAFGEFDELATALDDLQEAADEGAIPPDGRPNAGSRRDPPR